MWTVGERVQDSMSYVKKRCTHSFHLLYVALRHGVTVDGRLLTVAHFPLSTDVPAPRHVISSHAPPRANLSSNAAVAAERPLRYRCAISSTTHQSRGIGGSTWHPWAPCSLYLEHQAPRRSEGQQRLAEHTGIPGSADQQMRMA